MSLTPEQFIRNLAACPIADIGEIFDMPPGPARDETAKTYLRAHNAWIRAAQDRQPNPQRDREDGLD